MFSSLEAKARARIESPGLRKLIKYSLVSVVAIGVTVIVQFFCLYVLHMKGGKSAVVASTIAAFPSYYLNRRWVWGKGGRSHLMKEVLPFWIMFAIGLGFSAFVSALAHNFAGERIDSHGLRSLFVTASTIVAYGILWLGKFMIFNKVLFVHRESELDPALDGRTGLPT